MGRPAPTGRAERSWVTGVGTADPEGPSGPAGGVRSALPARPARSYGADRTEGGDHGAMGAVRAVSALRVEHRDQRGRARLRVGGLPLPAGGAERVLRLVPVRLRHDGGKFPVRRPPNLRARRGPPRPRGELPSLGRRTRGADDTGRLRRRRGLAVTRAARQVDRRYASTASTRR